MRNADLLDRLERASLAAKERSRAFAAEARALEEEAMEYAIRARRSPSPPLRAPPPPVRPSSPPLPPRLAVALPSAGPPPDDAASLASSVSLGYAPTGIKPAVTSPMSPASPAHSPFKQAVAGRLGARGRPPVAAPPPPWPRPTVPPEELHALLSSPSLGRLGLAAERALYWEARRPRHGARPRSAPAQPPPPPARSSAPSLRHTTCAVLPLSHTSQLRVAAAGGGRARAARPRSAQGAAGGSETWSSLPHARGVGVGGAAGLRPRPRSAAPAHRR